MSWAEIKKAVNSDLSTPLNSKIDAQTTTLANKFGLEYVETAACSKGYTFRRDYDAIVVNLDSATCGVFKGTTNTGTPLVYTNHAPFFKLEKNTDYFLTNNGATFAFYRLGGGI